MVRFYRLKPIFNTATGCLKNDTYLKVVKRLKNNYLALLANIRDTISNLFLIEAKQLQ